MRALVVSVLLIAAACSRPSDRRSPEAPAGTDGRTSPGASVEQRALAKVTSGEYLALDASHVYWGVAHAPADGLLDVWRISKDGGEAKLVVRDLVRLTQQAQFVVDHRILFGIRRDGVVRVDTDSGRVTVLVSGHGEELLGVAMDDEFVYYGDNSVPTISRVARGGGPARVLATGEAALSWDITCDGSHVYWFDPGKPFREGDEAVRAVQRDGGEILTLCQGNVGLVGAAEGVAYCASGEGIQAASIKGGSRGAVIPIAATMFQIAPTGRAYWYDALHDEKTREWRPSSGTSFTILASNMPITSPPVPIAQGIAQLARFAVDEDHVFLLEPGQLVRRRRSDR